MKAKAFPSPNELELLGRLEAAAPGLRFHREVVMGARLDPETVAMTLHAKEREQVTEASDTSVVRAHELLPWNWTTSA